MWYLTVSIPDICLLTYFYNIVLYLRVFIEFWESFLNIKIAIFNGEQEKKEYTI